MSARNNAKRKFTGIAAVTSAKSLSDASMAGGSFESRAAQAANDNFALGKNSEGRGSDNVLQFRKPSGTARSVSVPGKKSPSNADIRDSGSESKTIPGPTNIKQLTPNEIVGSGFYRPDGLTSANDNQPNKVQNQKPSQTSVPISRNGSPENASNVIVGAFGYRQKPVEDQNKLAPDVILPIGIKASLENLGKAESVTKSKNKDSQSEPKNSDQSLGRNFLEESPGFAPEESISLLAEDEDQKRREEALTRTLEELNKYGGKYTREDVYFLMNTKIQARLPISIMVISFFKALSSVYFTLTSTVIYILGVAAKFGVVTYLAGYAFQMIGLILLLSQIFTNIILAIFKVMAEIAYFSKTMKIISKSNLLSRHASLLMWKRVNSFAFGWIPGIGLALDIADNYSIKSIVYTEVDRVKKIIYSERGNLL